jgi:hypothetical protein
MMKPIVNRGFRLEGEVRGGREGDAVMGKSVLIRMGGG